MLLEGPIFFSLYFLCILINNTIYDIGAGRYSISCCPAAEMIVPQIKVASSC